MVCNDFSMAGDGSRGWRDKMAAGGSAANVIEPK